MFDYRLDLTMVHQATGDDMTSAQQAKQNVWDTLLDHFDETDRNLTADDVVSMTQLDRPVVENALRVLTEEGRVKGQMTNAPTTVTATGAQINLGRGRRSTKPSLARAVGRFTAVAGCSGDGSRDTAR